MSIISREPFEILQVDHIVSVVEGEGGYNYILVVTDLFTGKSWFLPAKNTTALHTYKLLFEHIFSPFFFPKYIYSDLGTSFNNELDKIICKATGMSHQYTRPNS